MSTDANSRAIRRVEIAKLFGSYVSSRHLAARLREELVEQITSGSVDVVELDFRDVETFSHSFADALVAVLFAGQGPEWARKHIRILNLDPDNRNELLKVVEARMRTRPPGVHRTVVEASPG